MSPVLSPRDLPSAELNAALLDGEVYRIDDCFSPVDQPELRVHRAMALSAIYPRQLIAEQRSAAWVLGALDRPPPTHQFCTGIDTRSRPASLAGITVREVVIEDADLVESGGLIFTAPLRTLIDLTRFSAIFESAEQQLVRRLMSIGGIGIDECRIGLDLRRNLPGKRRALARIIQSVGRDRAGGV